MHVLRGQPSLSYELVTQDLLTGKESFFLQREITVVLEEIDRRRKSTNKQFRVSHTPIVSATVAVAFPSVGSLPLRETMGKESIAGISFVYLYSLDLVQSGRWTLDWVDTM